MDFLFAHVAQRLILHSQKKALTTHQKVNHEGRRDFVCPHETCKRAFGYKHLLQRHLAKLHAAVPEADAQSSDHGEESAAAEHSDAPPFNIDDITGKTYKTRATAHLALAHKLQCPHPDLHNLTSDEVDGASGSKRCEFVFSRAYDLRRHLRSEHGVDLDKDIVSMWMERTKSRMATSA